MSFGFISPSSLRFPVGALFVALSVSVSVFAADPTPAPSPTSDPSASSPYPDLGNASPENLSRLRDPFQRPTLRLERGSPKTPLENYSIEQFELLGVISGPVKMRAMIKTPDSKTHLVSEKMKIGNRNGFVRRITSNSLLIREKVLNVFGQEEEVDTELKISSRAKEPSGGT